MRRIRRKLFNIFAVSLLSFSIYLNFFYKGDMPALLKSKPPAEKSTKSTADVVSKTKSSQN